MGKTKVITHAQYLQVEGLLALARSHKKIVDSCEAALNEMLEPEVEEYCGHTGDAIWSDYPATKLLKLTGVTVKK